MKKICSRLLISLDAVLDTRSGTLLLIDPEAGSKIIKNKYYASRVWDDFPIIDMNKFRKIYAERDKSVLKYSSMTNAIGIVRDFVQRVMNKNLNSPVEMDVEIHLNVHPYKLTDEERKLLVIAISSKLHLSPKVIVVDYSPEYLNPLFVRNTYNTMVLYDFTDWIEIHSKNELIKKYSIPEVTIFTPALLKFKDEQVPENLSEMFTNAMAGFQPFVNIVFLPIDIFCTYLANKPTSLTTPKSSKDEVSEKG